MHLYSHELGEIAIKLTKQERFCLFEAFRRGDMSDEHEQRKPVLQRRF